MDSNQNNRFAVVEFSDSSVAAVPIKWLIKSRSQCFWPPINATKLCKEYADAQLNWTVHSVSRIFGLYSSYAIARIQAIEAESYSTLESESELANLEQKKTTRKERRKKNINDDSDREEDVGKKNLSRIKPPPLIPVQTTTDGDIAVISFEDLEAEQQYHTLSTADEGNTGSEDNFLETEQASSSKSEGFCSESEPVDNPQILISQSALATMFRTLKTLELKVEQITLHVEEILRRFDRHQGISAGTGIQKITKPVGWPSKFPLEDDDSFQEWEKFLSANEKNFDYAVNYFSFVSKCGPAENARNFLSKIFTNKCAERFNWMGHGEKEAFKNTFTKKLLYAYPRTPTNSQEEKSMDEASKNWLKSAKARANYKRPPK